MSGILCHQGGGGSDFRMPLRTISRPTGASVDVHAPTLFQAFPSWWWYYEDFIVDALQSDEHFTLYDHSPSGSPTKAVVANATGGQLQLKCSSTSEAQTLAFYFDDNLLVQGNLPYLFAARVKVVHTMAANQQVIIGLASAMETDPVTFDYLTRNSWFRLETDADLMIEADDGTNDQDDKDTGADITSGDWNWYLQERGTNGKTYYGLINPSGFLQTWTLPEKFSGVDPSFGANNLQPLIAVHKASGTTTPEILIDAVILGGARAS